MLNQYAAYAMNKAHASKIAIRRTRVGQDGHLPMQPLPNLLHVVSKGCRGMTLKVNPMLRDEEESDMSETGASLMHRLSTSDLSPCNSMSGCSSASYPRDAFGLIDHISPCSLDDSHRHKVIKTDQITSSTSLWSRSRDPTLIHDHRPCIHVEVVE